MPSWQLTFGPDTKANVATALGAASIADATDMDAPAVVLSGAALTAHFTAAVSSAQGQLTALSGAAPNARVQLTGYYDVNTTPPIPATAASKISVSVSEFWT